MHFAWSSCHWNCQNMCTFLVFVFSSPPSPSTLNDSCGARVCVCVRGFDHARSPLLDQRGIFPLIPSLFSQPLHFLVVLSLFRMLRFIPLQQCLLIVSQKHIRLFFRGHWSLRMRFFILKHSVCTVHYIVASVFWALASFSCLQGMRSTEKYRYCLQILD